MKTLALFSRLRLGELFVELDRNLDTRFDVIHIAYSSREKAFIRSQLPDATVICFRDTFERFKKSWSTLDSIDRVALDREISLLSDGRTNLNAIINADRTMLGTPHKECIRTVKTYLECWKSIYRDYPFHFLLHEPVTLALTELAYYVAESNSSRYLALIQSYGVNTNNFLLVDAMNGEIFRNGVEKFISQHTIDSFLDKYHSDSIELYSQYSTLIPSRKNAFKNATKSIALDILRKIRSVIKEFFSSYGEKDIIDLYHIRSGSLTEKIKSTFYYYKAHNYDVFLSDESYYYYPLHVEPEATVLYWGRNRYTGQVKLIENIASQLPNGELLYVKDHPHAGAYRTYKDYQKLKAIPNVRLINPEVSGSDIICASKGVMTICGTSGFEALLYHKPVYLFGSTFYKMYQGVIRLESVFDLESILISDETTTTISWSAQDIAKELLSNVMEGFTDYFVDYPEKCGIDHEENCKVVAKEITYFLSK